MLFFQIFCSCLMSQDIRLPMDNLLDSAAGEIKTALRYNNQALGISIIKECLKGKIFPLNIAITGETGAGKSTFVNAFRGIDNKAEGAAPTGCVESSKEALPYFHPNYPNVILWDCPGIGTPNYPADKYLELVDFKKFDFFIIISDTFRENDVKLAREIKKMGKKFYFVRSKIDHYLRDEERSQREFDAEKILAQVRKKCIQGIQKAGVESPQVFLVSNVDIHLYDFPLLCGTFDKEFFAPERPNSDDLLATSQKMMEEINNEKKVAFMSEIKKYSFLSAAVAAVPLPGLSVAVDAAMMIKVVIGYVDGFGLDKRSLQKLADAIGVSLEVIKKGTKSPLIAEEITKDLLVRALFQCARIVALEAAEEGFRFIPIFGSLASASLSFMITQLGLNHILNILAEDAQKVFENALEEFKKRIRVKIRYAL